MKIPTIKKAEGKLGVLVIGLGAVTTTFLAGIEAIRSGYKKPVGTLTELGRIRLGKKSDNNFPLIRDVISLTNLKDMEFLVWDVFSEDAYQASLQNKVLDKEDIEHLKPFLQSIKPASAIFNRKFVKKLDGQNVKKGSSHRENIELLKQDISKFKQEKNIDRMVMIWAGSTEVFCEASEIHLSITNFEKGLDANDSSIPPSQLYAYAALSEGIPFLNGAPNLTVDCVAMLDLAKKNNIPLAGKDFKTGQTLMKTILAPGIQARLLQLDGWFSTNILGNRDGEVLDDPDSFKTKEVSKLSVLDSILDSKNYPDLYGDYFHKVRINYYPPRGDNKEGWDNIDISGWMDYKMQIKIDFLCRDSILAAPLMLDLVLFTDFAQRAGLSGIQEWLSFYFKSPQTPSDSQAEHNLFAQLMNLKNTIRQLAGEEPVTDLGDKYYDL